MFVGTRCLTEKGNGEEEEEEETMTNGISKILITDYRCFYNGLEKSFPKHPNANFSISCMSEA